MKAIVQDRYGPPDVLQLREIDEPGVGDDQVLVRVRDDLPPCRCLARDAGRAVRPPDHGVRAAQTEAPCSRYRSGRERRVGRQERDAIPSGR